MLGNDHRCYASGLLLLDLFLGLIQVDGENSVTRNITSNDAMNKMRLFAMREQWCPFTRRHSERHRELLNIVQQEILAMRGQYRFAVRD